MIEVDTQPAVAAFARIVADVVSGRAHWVARRVERDEPDSGAMTDAQRRQWERDRKRRQRAACAT